MALSPVKFNLRLPEDLKATLEAQAAAQDLSLNQLVVKVLRREADRLQGATAPPRVRKASTRLAAAVVVKVGRNEPCPCGSGKKAKFCCPELTR